jgi:hypothetical protein
MKNEDKISQWNTYKMCCVVSKKPKMSRRLTGTEYDLHGDIVNSSNLKY